MICISEIDLAAIDIYTYIHIYIYMMAVKRSCSVLLLSRE
uniref:Uncharacterized protein n=1 Tax=Rhizophora mucronata TaxID=61149 RepID=A0A2P2N8I8_RHIMU